MAEAEAYMPVCKDAEHGCKCCQAAAFAGGLGQLLAHRSVTEVKYVLCARHSQFKQGASLFGPNRCVQNILRASSCHRF